MLFSDTYKTIDIKGESSLKFKGSKFFGFAFHVKNEEMIKKILSDLRIQFSDASHCCYAWRIGAAKTAFRTDDDGEPSGSAGRPIFKYIQNQDLTNVIIIVIRYFGGTLLGIPGLIEAYGDTAKMAIENAKISTKTINDIYSICCEYNNESEAYRLIRFSGAAIITCNRYENIIFEISIRQSSVSTFLHQSKTFHKLKVLYLRTEQ
ncbi:MAG: YigZ family protein [Bacteroidia bacterium]|nr:YigZ family protein [Bacteroidia bacterium]